MDAMENPNHIFTGLTSEKDVRIHRGTEPEPSTSRARRINKEEKIDINTDDAIEMEDLGKDSTDKNVDTTAETLDNHLLINGHELQNIANEPSELPQHIRSLSPTDDIFRTFEDKDRKTNKTLSTRWLSFCKAGQDGWSCTLGNLWMWRILCLILVFVIVVLIIYTKRPVYNYYHIYS